MAVGAACCIRRSVSKAAEGEFNVILKVFGGADL